MKISLSCSRVALSIILLLTSFGSCSHIGNEEEYKQIRDELSKRDHGNMFGASMKLDDPREAKVNEILMKYKEKEYTEGVESHGRLFPAAKNFFAAKESIEGSNVFKIIKMLPKGGNLHSHLTPATNLTFAVQNLTKWKHLYYCVQDDEHLQFKFSKQNISKPCSEGAGWKKVSKLYKGASSEKVIQDWFRSSMYMGASLQQVMNSDGKEAWRVFEAKIKTIGGLVKYEKANMAAYRKVLQDHLDDNVMYLEMRSGMRKVHRLDQSILTLEEIIGGGKKVTDEFVRDNPDFCGAKAILAPHRFHTIDGIYKYLNESIELRKAFPKFFIGFDLVGYEDKGVPLKKFLPQFLEAGRKNVSFFFHSGETNWYGTIVDENLLDAILLHTKRIGHGFALYRHPVLYNLAKNQSIAVEVCPISNQVLRQVEDLRIHPAAAYFRDGFPVVVASDDNGLYDSAPLSHDWYFAFMAIGGQRADLRFLKQLAKNSIAYSAMDSSEKEACFQKWEVKWSEFLDKVIKAVPS